MGVLIREFEPIQGLCIQGAIFKGEDVEELYKEPQIVYSISDGELTKFSQRATFEELQDILEAQKLQDGDAFFMATDQFMQYVEKTDLLIDYVKSKDAGAWMSYLMTRVGLKLEDDNLNYSALAICVRED